MFVVMRTHSRSTRGRGALWQVMSRDFRTREEAEGWCQFLQEEYQELHPRGAHKFFVIETQHQGFRV